MEQGSSESSYRVLVVGNRKALPEDLPQAVEQRSRQEIVAEVTPTISLALEMLSSRGFDAALCWVECDDELAGVIRIRKARPGLPIMVVTRRSDPGFAALAQQAGATTTTTAPEDPGALTDEIGQTLRSWSLAREVREQSKVAKTFAKEIRTLAQDLRNQIELGKRRLASPRFAAVLVQEDRQQVDLMTRAFQTAKLQGPLLVLKSHDELRLYLTEESRVTQPYPSVILVDLDLPGSSGFDILRWVRGQSAYLRCPVVVLSSVADPARIRQAYELGANSFLTKPRTFEAMVDVVVALHAYWGVANQKPEA